MGLARESDYHVLAVDDSIIDRKLIERLLKTSSYKVTTVDSGTKALEFLALCEDEKIKPQVVEVNLIITDYCMPGMTGYDLLKKVKESSSLRNIPVIIMSSENVPSRITRCLEEGAEEFFLKPVRLSDVNKLRPHIIKTKRFQNLQTSEDQVSSETPQLLQDEKQEKEDEQQQQSNLQDEKQEKEDEQQQQSNLQDEKQEKEDEQQQQSINNKRKLTEEGVSPDRTRQRYNGFTLVSN